ncbi:MAG: MATE family efflux transporter [Apibacter sp.]|jgi:putative MATE family efflux protein|nr:MATE family efflux transporter [Apibacter sp.]
MEAINKSQNISELENEKPRKLIWKYAIPAIIGTIVIALYNIIDSIYIGHGENLGDHAIGGLGVLLPIMNLISGIGMLVGSGASTRTSIFLGQKDIKSANCVLGNSIILAIVLTLLLIIGIYTYMDSILTAIGSTPQTFPFAKEFLLYYLPGNVFLTVNYALNSIMRASGYPKKAMYMMLIGVAANIILAPVFIFILQWGMKGAAIATNLSMAIGLCVVLKHFFKSNSIVSFQWDSLKPNFKIIWSIINVGFAPFFMLIAASIVVLFINNRLNVYGGSTAIEAYTIANRLIMVFIMVLVGLTQGMQPIIGYNYGAKNMSRVKETLSYSLKSGLFIGCLGFLFGFLLPELVVTPFNPSPKLAKEASLALQIMTITLPLSGIQMVISNFFQCIGKAVIAFILSMSRQFLVLVPSLFILPNYLKLNGVWYSIPLSDTISTILALIIFIWQIRKFKNLI